MKEKKHIDRIFQEKFKDFEASPRDAVWHKISKNLQEDNRKKTLILPLWTKIAGVAAFVVFLLLLADWFAAPQEIPRISDTEEIENNFSSEKTSIAYEDSTELSSEEVLAITSERKNDTSALPDEKIILPRISGITARNYKDRLVKIFVPLTGLAQIKGFSLSAEKVPENSNINILKQTTEESITENTSDPKFEISTHAAPIFYGNLGQASFIDTKFNNNSNSGKVTYSYGINIAYTISKDLKIRSGISKVATSYNTNNIAYHAVIDPSAIKSIDYTKELVVIKMNRLSAAKNSDPQAIARSRAAIGSFDPGFLNQRIGFIEIPVELEYNVIDKKIKLNIIGGASTLFLNENMISVHTSNLTTKLGAANNLHEISFSTNIGLGLGYNLSENLQLNVEPMFKYQLNTFKTTSQEVQPYYLGIYSGFSFKF